MVKKWSVYKNRISALFQVSIIILATVLSCFLDCKLTTQAASNGRIVVSFDRQTLGQGFLIEPVEVEYNSDDTGATIILSALKKAGYKAVYAGDGQSGFYLKGIKKADTGKLNIPKIIQDMKPYEVGKNNYIKPPTNKAKNDYAPDLCEFSYSTMSGWMYSVNGNYPGYGLSDYEPSNGDVLEVRFSVFGYGTDLGKAATEDDEVLDIADRHELVGLIGQINADSDKWFEIEEIKTAYDAAVKIIKKFDASQGSVNDACDKLKKAMNLMPTDEEIAQDVSDLINSFSEEITMDNCEEVMKIWLSYEELTSLQKSYIDNVTVERLNGLCLSAKDLFLNPAYVVLNYDDVLTEDASVAASLYSIKEKYLSLIKKYKGFFTEEEKATMTDAFSKIPVSLKGIELPKTVNVSVKKTAKIKVTPIPSDTTDSLEFKYKSSNTKVATVSKTGVVTGKEDGKCTITVTSLNNLAIKKTCTVKVTSKAKKLTKSVDKVLQETNKYILSIDKNPGAASQWFAIGRARNNSNLSDDYYELFYKNMVTYIAGSKGQITRAKYSDYSKAILSITATGHDARNVNGYNLLGYLADFDNVKKQGLNGPIWALIAVNSNPDYEIPKKKVKNQTTKKKLINYILDAELEGGGWALTGKSADVDVTAMAIQSLSHYYGKADHKAETKAIDRALKWLGKNQNSKTGGYKTMGCENSESCAQVIVALCSLGIDPAKDTRFVKYGNWTVSNLISYHVSDSGFMHVKKTSANNGGAEAGKVNGIATEQAFYSLVAYQRLLDGKTSLYDMSDVKIKVSKKLSVRQKYANGKYKKKKKANDELEKTDEEYGETSGDEGWEFAGEDYEAKINIISSKDERTKDSAVSKRIIATAILSGLIILVGGFTLIKRTLKRKRSRK